MLPGVFESTLFSGQRLTMAGPRFIRAMHPRSELEPRREVIDKVLKAGWWGQVKIHGHRAQVHIPREGPLTVFNRQGGVHAKALPAALERELRRLFAPTKGSNVLDCEWLKREDRLYVFDILRADGELLDGETYAERYERLPRILGSPCIETLGVLKTTASCLKVLEDENPRVEGLVFKAPFVRGFADSAIVRCRKAGHPHRS